MMNKKYFLEKLEEETKLSSEKCLIISDVLDDTFIVGKKNKEKMISAFIERLNINKEKAEEIYEKTMNIIKTSIKEKVKHPFKNVD